MNSELRIRPGTVEWRQFEQEVVAVDTRKSIYLALNRSGAILWPALLEGTTRERLVGLLVESYDLDRGQAEQDVDTFLQALGEQDLLEA